MLFLADECCALPTVQLLRSLGHDVTHMIEVAPGDQDIDVLKRSRDEQRILLTEDLDFGEMVFRDKLPAYGIVTIRIWGVDRQTKAQLVASAIGPRINELPGMMATVTIDGLSLRSLPKPD